ncbi:MAG: hypothetical protein C6W56_07485 [Caldibacillus debilis]|nr:MAG: hypothetical protein C6W56_07485 [Caldibacillus debilis]
MIFQPLEQADVGKIRGFAPLLWRIFFPDFYSCAGENYLQTLENTDFFRLQKIFIIIFCIYANKSCYNNKNLDILPFLAYIH